METGVSGARLSRGEEALEATRPESVRRGGDGGPWLEKASDLAALLLPNELLERLGAVEELTVFPHGPLNLVPFALLPADEDDTPLGNRVAVRYSPSLETLLLTRRPRPGVVDRAAMPGERGAITAPLVVGNPAMPTITAASGERVPLPWAAFQLVGAQ